MTQEQLANCFNEQGFCHLRAFLSETEIASLRAITARFHKQWKKHNRAFYSERAINSAYLTHKDHMSSPDRQTLFQIIASRKMKGVITPLLPEGVAFMNTQLFFNPLNPEQKNYWHRDTQYQFSEAQEKASLGTLRALHFRLALYDEPGVELVPGSHREWDTPEELDVRLVRNGRMAHEDLPRGRVVSMNAGDLLIFDAAMLHRGLYGKQRLALDILFCDPSPALLKYADPDCLPDEAMLKHLAFQVPFIVARDILSAQKSS